MTLVRYHKIKNKTSPKVSIVILINKIKVNIKELIILVLHVTLARYHKIKNKTSHKV